MERIDPISLLILSLQIGLRRASLPIARQTQLEASRKIVPARAAAVARWVDMSRAEIHGQPATADRAVSRETKMPLAGAATVVVAAMPNAAEAAGTAEAVGIEAAEKRAIEEFQWRRME